MIEPVNTRHLGVEVVGVKTDHQPNTHNLSSVVMTASCPWHADTRSHCIRKSPWKALAGVQVPDEGQVFISSAHSLESAKRSMEAHLKDLFLRALGNSCDSIRTNNSSTVPPRVIARTKKSPGAPHPQATPISMTTPCRDKSMLEQKARIG